MKGWNLPTYLPTIILSTVSVKYAYLALRNTANLLFLLSCIYAI